MLPKKYTTPATRSNLYPIDSPPSQSRQPPLGITGVICSSHKLTIENRGQLHYVVYRPRMLHPAKTNIPNLCIPPPLICVAGGPGLSCQYLTVLVHHITDRAVIVFDALGCGQSTHFPKAKLSVESAASDLIDLIQRVVLNSNLDKRFHLLGHSYGGIVSFEALRKSEAVWTRCASLILSNTPCNVANALDRRLEFCSKWDEDEETNDEDEELTASTAHFRRHECRRTPVPLLLNQSLANVNKKAKNYDRDWETYSPVAGFCSTRIPAALLISGQYDYVTDCDAWKEPLRDCCEDVRTVMLAGTSHFCMVEDESLYGTVTSTFLRDWDGINND